jgi:hypothetical protein
MLMRPFYHASCGPDSFLSGITRLSGTNDDLISFLFPAVESRRISPNKKRTLPKASKRPCVVTLVRGLGLSRKKIRDFGDRLHCRAIRYESFPTVAKVFTSVAL